MRICLYIPCRNGEATLPEVLEAVRGQVRAADQVLLVDDQSTDATVEIALRAGWSVVHTTPERCGLAAARNRAVAFAVEAGCDVLAGIDADAVPAADYIVEMATFFATHHAVVGLCGNMQERFTQSVSDLWRAVYMRQHYGSEFISNPPILYGSSAAYRLSALVPLGGFDESLRTNFEDTEFTQRMLAAGHQLAYVPLLRLEHLKRDTPDSVLRMFWNWYRPPAERAGHFANVDAWLRQRLSWIWHDFRIRMRGDESVPRLAALTSALPWTQIVRDLQLIDRLRGTATELGPLIDMAADIHATRGFGKEGGAWIRERMERAVEPSASGERVEVDQQILANVRDLATFALPRRAYWDDLAASIADASSCRADQSPPA